MTTKEITRPKQPPELDKAPDKRLEEPKRYKVVLTQGMPFSCFCIERVLSKTFNIEAAHAHAIVRTLIVYGRVTVLESTREVAETKSGKGNAEVDKIHCGTPRRTGTRFHFEPV